MVKPGDFVGAGAGMIVSVTRPVYDGESVKGTWFVNGQLRHYVLAYSSSRAWATAGGDTDALYLDTSGALRKW